MGERAQGNSVFRPHRMLAAAMLGAAALWGYAFYFLSGLDGVPWKTTVTAAVFTGFFLIATLYYGRTAFFIDEAGVTYRGMIRSVRFRFDEIRSVRVLPGPLTVYSICAANRFIHFTSFFRRHRALLNMLVERSGTTAGAV